MTPEDRAALARRLAAMDCQPLPGEQGGPGGPVSRGDQNRRTFFLAGTILCVVALLAWTIFLAMTLPRFYRSGGWRGAWVGFDVALLATFAATAWAAWRHRQLVVICLIVLATLLCCDAWFDVMLDQHTRGFLLSVLSAVLVELPLAALAVFGAHRLLRSTVSMIGQAAGTRGPVPPLWRIPLYGVETRGFRNLIPSDPCFEGPPEPQPSAAGQRGSGG
jgi:hypothetical protein